VSADDIAMQSLCVHCLGEQYALAVYFVSMGEEPCAWCGAYSEKMTTEKYWQTLREARATRDARDAAARSTVRPLRPPRQRGTGE
jgi:hypothetical protein